MGNRTTELFATKIITGSLTGARSLNSRLELDIRDLSKQDKLGRDWSKENYRGGYTSYASLSDMHQRTPSFMELSEKLQTAANAFAKANDWDMRGMELVMTACWMNIMPKGTYHTLHLHPHSVISGAYYVTAPKGSVAIKLEDPRMGFLMNAPLTKKPALYQRINPKAGSYLMFESWLRHEVPPNESKSPRVSISFNFSLEAKSE